MSAATLAPWAGTVISMGDIGVYATLCALATLGRADLKARVVESEGVAGEGEGMKELLEAWMGSNFRTVLELLSNFSVSAQWWMMSPRFSPEQWLTELPGSGSFYARSSARPTRLEPHFAHPLPRSRALFPTIRDD
jgi:hypothetical protein